MPAKRKRSLKAVVGEETYAVWVAMLKTLVPSGRTHRLAPLVAAMLQYALEQTDESPEEGSVAEALVSASETGDPSETEDLIGDVVAQLFKDAGVDYRRTNARGQPYSIAEQAYLEFTEWFNMPWE